MNTEPSALTSELVVDLAKTFITAIRRIDSEWKQAYWSFTSEEDRFGSNASYVTDRGVFLVDSIKETALFKQLNRTGRQLWENPPPAKKRFCACLLIASSNFDYEIKFEYHDMKKWRITKMDGVYILDKADLKVHNNRASGGISHVRFTESDLSGR